MIELSNLWRNRKQTQSTAFHYEMSCKFAWQSSYHSCITTIFRVAISNSPQRYGNSNHFIKKVPTLLLSEFVKCTCGNKLPGKKKVKHKRHSLMRWNLERSKMLRKCILRLFPHFTSRPGLKSIFPNDFSRSLMMSNNEFQNRSHTSRDETGDEVISISQLASRNCIKLARSFKRQLLVFNFGINLNSSFIN